VGAAAQGGGLDLTPIVDHLVRAEPGPTLKWRGRTLALGYRELYPGDSQGDIRLL
jgi:hypothetical protein